ncbi:cardiolipin synthase [Anaerosporobacter faecicola]|uniref:cardiolipin synthase n=1 Tax=Anaerosporobacter faecicola TaxID=2718714 RepID=UPI001439675E|nr:cardiolipin synthase [Anaerosporobacter faecicola]
MEKVKEITVRLVKVVLSRIFIVGVILALQVGWMILFLVKLSEYSAMISALFNIISALAVLYIINKQDNPAYKLAWVVPILLFPLLGGLLYASMGNKQPSRRLRAKLDAEYNKMNPSLEQSAEVLEELEKSNKQVALQSRYIHKVTNFPIYKNTTAKYYKSGEDNYPDMLQELRKAKHYIFLEYFIIDEGKMWDQILEILVEKVKQGVEVRLIYDDFGCLRTLPYPYYQKMERLGIKCFAFNPYIPIFSVVMNHRDHRKILVIDGHTAFTGGINLADEYINHIERFGYWKDAGIMLKGEAVWNFTVMFLQMWNAMRPTDEDISVFKPHIHFDEVFESDGYVQPYGDTPLDQEVVGENVYLNLINGATRYIYMYTPYLIIDNEMMTALCLAAKKGVDVRIVTPGIPDKKYVFWLTQSYYSQLVQNGVKIYEYQPGFIHAKCFVCDDEVATVGTINMDYRSLYLHFECGVFLYQSNVVKQVKEDAMEVFSVSKRITEKDCHRRLPMRLIQAILRLFAPLM